MRRTAGLLFTVLTSLMIVFVMSVSVFAAALTPADAERKALADAGLSASEVTGLRTEFDKGCYEVEFANKARNAKYDYEISAENGRIKEVNIEYRHKKNYSKASITKKAAYKTVAKASGKKLATVKSGSCRLKKDDGEWVYEIKFKSGKYRYEYEVHAATGKITEFEKEYKGK